MDRTNQNDFFKVKFWIVCFFGLIAIIGVFWGLGALNKVYDVWAEGKAGEAELARAESNRKIKTLEAKAQEESASYLAQSGIVKAKGECEAEIIRAKGVAEANKIIGDSLKGNESYLRYLWITGLDQPNKEIIYIPTEANLPILEASRIK